MEERLNILYLHGYGSKFDPDSDKIKALKKIGDVSGPDLDYGKGQKAVFEDVLNFVDTSRYDLIVGTSMGGWLASHMCRYLCTPFCALNPAIKPSESLQKYVGQTINYVGHDCHIDAEAVASYEGFMIEGGFGLVLCEEGDELLDARTTIDYLKEFYDTNLVPGGSHRFESLADHLEELKFTAFIAGIIWGSEDYD